MDEVKIRPATLEDVPFLRRMEWEALLASPQFVAAKGLGTLRELQERSWPAWPLLDETAFVAEDAQGRSLGAVMLKVHERDRERVVGVRLAIGAEAGVRGRGIGRRLLEHAKRWTRDMGADYLLLLVDTTNEPALRAYRATGFRLGDQDGVVPMTARFTDDAGPRGRGDGRTE